jgi:hypothetical protein
MWRELSNQAQSNDYTYSDRYRTVPYRTSTQKTQINFYLSVLWVDKKVILL